MSLDIVKFFEFLKNKEGREYPEKVKEYIKFSSISHFNNYLKDDDYYVFFNYGDPKSPYQFHYHSNQFRDKTDKSLIDLNSI